jgi:hypothetical protein
MIVRVGPGRLRSVSHSAFKLTRDAHYSYPEYSRSFTTAHSALRPRQFLGQKYPLSENQLRLVKYLHTSKSLAMMADTEKWTALKVRETFLDYFKERGHTFGKYSTQFNRTAFNRASLICNDFYQSLPRRSFLSRTLPSSSPMQA